MDQKLETSNTEFVVRPEDPEKFAREFVRSGSGVDASELSSDRLLYLVRPGCDDLDVAVGLDRVREQTGEENVSPALIDVDGNVLYPTGDIQVRFEEVLDDDAIEKFSEEHGLAVKERNEFQPLQIKFEIVHPRAKLLTEELDELNRQKGVVKAWPVTMARYRRGR